MTDDNISLEASAEDFGALDPVADLPVSQAHAVASLALNFAMKYHDIATIQDGTLYQQYKLEGRNMTTLHLDMVFETAVRIEQWIMNTPNRLSETIYNNLIEGIALDATLDAEGGEDEAPEGLK